MFADKPVDHVHIEHDTTLGDYRVWAYRGRQREIEFECPYPEHDLDSRYEAMEGSVRFARNLRDLDGCAITSNFGFRAPIAEVT